VYVGPTLAADEVRRMLPDADVRGPVAVGDVLRVVEGQGARTGGARTRTRGIGREPRVGRIAIIDGYFERMAAVWHKELLLAIEAGIEVWGAASMGALRAAELAPFGMRGVGTIYERFARGELVADDEVAVAHLPAEYGYRATSVALVDLREEIERLASASPASSASRASSASSTSRASSASSASRASKSSRARANIEPHDRDRLIDLARAPFYRDRSWSRLQADAKAAGLSAAIVDALGDPAMTRASRKADDARLLLETMAAVKPAMTRSATTKSATTKSATTKSATPKSATPKSATPKSATPKSAQAMATPLRVPRTWALGQLRAHLARR